MTDTTNREIVLLVGNGKLAASIYMCLAYAGRRVDFFSDNPVEANERVNLHIASASEKGIAEAKCKNVEDIGKSPLKLLYQLAIIITEETLPEKEKYIQQVEAHVPLHAIIAINTESIALSKIQQYAAFPSRVIAVNWSEPAHTTYFLEVITNKTNPKELVEDFCQLSRSWQKDPYVLYNDRGIRSRMMCAMIREAFYLVENGYVSIEDIDRACRNDAGFYLPFAGNFRYMDLMGTYMYGIVMKDLNPELCSADHIPGFFKEIIDQGGEGMKNNHGLYSYQNGDTEKWDEVFRTFSYQIRDIIRKYPLENKQPENVVEAPLTSMHE